MIASVSGVLEQKEGDRVVVQVGGVGLRVLVPASVAAALGDPGDTVHLHTHLQVREDALTLYGFADRAQLRLFDLLIGVTGVGPAVALGIIALAEANAIEAAIAGGSAAFFSGAPRVGMKLAQRIVLELKPKVRKLEGIGSDGTALAGPAEDDVVAALLALGYTAGEAHAAASAAGADPSVPTEEKIRRALAYFNR